MKCLIIGGSGFIGTYLINKLISDNHDVLNFDLKESKIRQLETVVGDINKKNDLDRVSGNIDCLYILAAVHRDDITDYSKYYKTNCDGLNNVIEFSNARNINKIIYYSTAAVYGDTFINAKEDGELSPVSHYGKSKAKAEKALKKWASNANKQLLIIRPSVVYGLGSNSNMNRLINYVVANKFFIIGRGGNIKSISYVQNLIEFTLYASSKIESQIEIFNYSDFPHKTLREICDKISTISKSRRVMSVPYIFAYIFGVFLESTFFIINKKSSINLDRIKKSRTHTSLSTEKIEAIKYFPKNDFNKSISNTIQG